VFEKGLFVFGMLDVNPVFDFVLEVLGSQSRFDHDPVEEHFTFRVHESRENGRTFWAFFFKQSDVLTHYVLQ
jgi:hypothetical protein